MPSAESPAVMDCEKFVTRWQDSAAAERANYQLFLTELCDILAVPKPEPTRPDVSQNAYVFERDVTFQNLTRAKVDDLAELLETLVTLGKARTVDDNRYVAA
jgi:hypothetical protein